MARDDAFLVRHTSLPAVGEASSQQGVINRMGFQVVTDFLTQLVLGGFAYHIQAGTEDAPVASTAAIDDALAFMLVDQTAGNAMIALGCQIQIANWTTATLVNSMLEADKDKARYSSGGTIFVPANLRGDDPRSFGGVAYTVTADIVAAAKSAVPNSVELKRGTVVEDAQATPPAADANVAFSYSARVDPIIVLVDASSFVVHHGATTADVNSYGNFQFAQFDKTLVV